MAWTWDSTSINFADTDWTFDGWVSQVLEPLMTAEVTATLGSNEVIAVRYDGVLPAI